MSSNNGVSIRPIFSVPGKPVDMKDVTDFYKVADGNRDGKISSDEVKTFRLLSGVALLSSVGDDKKQERYDKEFGRFDRVTNLFAAFGGDLGIKNPGGIPLASFHDLAQKDGNDQDISAQDLGKRKWYYGDEKGGLSHEEKL